MEALVCQRVAGKPRGAGLGGVAQAVQRGGLHASLQATKCEGGGWVRMGVHMVVMVVGVGVGADVGAYGGDGGR